MSEHRPAKTYTVTKTFPHSMGLSAVFRQHRAESHCKYLHGYALQFEVVIICDELDERGWVYDFGHFKHLKEYLQYTFDHTLLVALDDPQRKELEELAIAKLVQPRYVQAVGAEAFANMVYNWMSSCVQTDEDLVDRGVRVYHVTCSEHEGNAATVWSAEDE